MRIRYLPITCLYPSSTKDIILPLICISGKWLEIAGFITGNEVSVQVKSYGELVIKLISDTETKFVYKCNEKSDGAVIDRLSRIYPNIFIDEIQDLAGYDLELIKLFLNSASSILLVGDPRQVTYLTHNERKYSKYIETTNLFEAEKLNFITLSSKTIVISYDDLLSYENYFDSPIYFLHFLKQRKIAIDIPQIAMRDELDHLGMYIKHNMYSITASEFPAEHMVNWHGFREDLDNYFCRLYLPELNPTKPKQDIPNEITEIIQLLERGIDENRIDVVHFLLNLSSEAKDDFCRAIHHALRRQPEIGRMVVMSAFGEIKYCLFVAMPRIKVMNTQERQDYVLSAILSDESMPIMWIDLDYDKDGMLLGANGKQCRYSDIPSDEIDRLKELSVVYAKSRIESFRRQNHRKVGRNEPCPCGSGKKYKKCCLQYEGS